MDIFNLQLAGLLNNVIGEKNELKQVGLNKLVEDLDIILKHITGQQLSLKPHKISQT